MAQEQCAEGFLAALHGSLCGSPVVRLPVECGLLCLSQFEVTQVDSAAVF